MRKLKPSNKIHLITQQGSCSTAENEFNEKAGVYETNRLSAWYKAHGKRLMNMLVHDVHGTILDVGCGTGWLLRQICKSHNNVRGIGIDIADQMIKVAKEKAHKENLSNLSFLKGDWESLDIAILGNEAIGIILCVNAFHYFSDPIAAAEKMFHTLSEEGRFFMLEREKASSLLTNTWDIFHKYLIKDHVQFYHSSQLIQAFENAGFIDIEIVERVKKYFWKKKIFTSLVIITGRKP